MTQRQPDHRSIDADERGAQTMRGFGPRSRRKPIRKPRAQRWIQPHGENGRDQDGDGPGPRRGRERPVLLSIQSKDRQERHTGDQQRKERRAAHLVQCRANGLLDAARGLPLQLLWTCSTTKIDASTNVPAASAHPPIDRMSSEIPSGRQIPSTIRILTGAVTIGIIAEGKSSER